MTLTPDVSTATRNGAYLNDKPARRKFLNVNELLLHLIDTLSLPLGEQAARRALRDFAKDAGFEFFAYLNLRGQESSAVSNYPREWQEHYVRMDYLRVDPVVTRAKHGPPIFQWSAGDAKRLGRRDVKQFFRDADLFGIRSGLSISVPVGFKDRMVFTLASGEPSASIGMNPDPVTVAIAVAFVHSRLGSANRTRRWPPISDCPRARLNACAGLPMACRCPTSLSFWGSAIAPSDPISMKRPASLVRQTAGRQQQSPSGST